MYEPVLGWDVGHGVPGISGDCGDKVLLVLSESIFYSGMVNRPINGRRKTVFQSQQLHFKNKQISNFLYKIIILIIIIVVLDTLAQ